MESNCGENNKRQSYPELSDDGPIPTVSWQMPEGQPYILDMAEEGISCNPNSLNIPPRFRTQHTLQVKHERRHAMSFVTKWEPIPRGFEPKGALGIECRTYSRLVSPGLGPEKKKWRALQIAFRMFVEHCIDLYKVLCRLLSLNHTSGNG